MSYVCQNQQDMWQRIIKYKEEQRPLAMDTSCISFYFNNYFKEIKLNQPKADLPKHRP